MINYNYGLSGNNWASFSAMIATIVGEQKTNACK